MHDPTSTLVAVATPPGRGGIGCLRLSGPGAHALGRRLFRPQGEEPSAGGRPAFGRFVGRDDRPVDHGYLFLLPGERAYTAEPTAELWTHGSPAVLDELVRTAVAAGATPASPGEFSYRAVLNGRLDLARAEAVRDLIGARTLYQARVAFAQAEGSLSRRLAPLRERLADTLARGEAAVEFVDESETHLPRDAMAQTIGETLTACRELLSGFERGRVVREGATLALSGQPNVGKSSLFNQLLARDRAIVTEVPGTTRDTLEETLDLDGIAVTLVDTAGLREATDSIEGEGVRRAERARLEADLVVTVLDGSRELDPDERPAADAPRHLVVINKVDLPRVARVSGPAIEVSAKTGAGIDALRRAIRERLVDQGPLEDPILSDARHAAALEQTVAGLERAAAALDRGLSEELVLEDLRVAMLELGSITGEFTSDDLYDRIFSTFCIGK